MKYRVETRSRTSAELSDGRGPASQWKESKAGLQGAQLTRQAHHCSRNENENTKERGWRERERVRERERKRGREEKKGMEAENEGEDEGENERV